MTAAQVLAGPTILIDVEDASSAADVAAVCEAAARDALAACPGDLATAELSILVTDDATVRDLNRRFRGIDKPTNVLSFPLDDETAQPGGARMLGDIALALPTVTREAAEQEKRLQDHLYHLVVHGVLHLLGYDHENDADADLMESLEVRILATAGIADPYSERQPGAEDRAEPPGVPA